MYSYIISNKQPKHVIVRAERKTERVREGGRERYLALPSLLHFFLSFILVVGSIGKNDFTELVKNTSETLSAVDRLP